MKISLVSLVVGRPWDVDDRLWELIEPLLPRGRTSRLGRAVTRRSFDHAVDRTAEVPPS